MQALQFVKDIEYTRTSATKEELKAANYIKKQLKEIGLEGKLETFDTQYAEIVEAKLEVVEPYKKQYECIGVMCSKDCNKLTKEIYYYRGHQHETTCVDVKDKIVLFDTAVGYWKYKEIFEAGAAGYIICNGYLIDDNKDIYKNELRGPLREVGEIPGLSINIKDAYEMVDKGATKVRITLKQKPKSGESRNVVCKIKGEKDPTIVFTAHYDSTPLSKGAYDNATGSAGIFKIAEYYSKHKPKHNLVFIWCGSEERGLLGSKAYVKKHKKELDKMGLCINLDMIGCTLGSFLVTATSEDKLCHYVEYLSKEVGFSLETSQGVYSSDSTPFADNGVPAISFARLTQYSPIHNRYDDSTMLNEKILDEDIDFILTFTKRMDDAVYLPVNRVIPDKIKEELDIYLLRKKKGAK